MRSSQHHGVSESFQHIAEKERPQLRFCCPAQAPCVRCERLPKSLVQPEREFPGSVGPVRNFRIQQSCEFGVGRMYEQSLQLPRSELKSNLCPRKNSSNAKHEESEEHCLCNSSPTDVKVHIKVRETDRA